MRKEESLPFSDRLVARPNSRQPRGREVAMIYVRTARVPWDYKPHCGDSDGYRFANGVLISADRCARVLVCGKSWLLIIKIVIFEVYHIFAFFKAKWKEFRNIVCDTFIEHLRTLNCVHED